MTMKSLQCVTALLRHATGVVALGFVLAGCGGDDGPPAADVQVSRTEPAVIYVSIPPQAAFVEHIAGDRAQIHVMVKPGHSPATYEPTPSQMVQLSEAHLYFRIGVPFEEAWLPTMREANPRMRIVDTRDGIELRSVTGRDHGHDDGHAAEQRGGDHERKDPHIWLDPGLVKIQAGTIAEALKRVDPYNSHRYETSLVSFREKLADLDRAIRQELAGLENRTFMVFHPSWGYFAAAYDLEQLAVEIEGKDPGGKSLAGLIERARNENIRAIFVQPQFSSETARAVARAIDAEVVEIDPLARDYFENMRRVAAALAGKGRPD